MVKIIFINAFLYLLIIAGFIILFFDSIRIVYYKLILRGRLRANTANKGKLELTLAKALHTSLGKRVSPGAFIASLTIIFTTFFLISIKTLSLVSSLIISSLVGSLPCLLIWIRLEAIRRRGSHEGEILVSEFLRQYRLTNYNVYETLERIVEAKIDIKNTRRLIYKLLIDLRSTGNPKRIKEATEDFAYAIQTNWSNMLAHNIYIAASKGTNVTLAIEDILIQLREARAMVEERKRLNNEATRMTYFMVPLVYIATAFMAVKYLDLPLKRFLYNQLYTQEGFVILILIIFFFVANIALLSLVINQRFDY
ncbi:MAG: hypothetical protein GX363_01825 [Clostridiales bacterium]|jgi:hypothetical protein|nr:hypothetical protein [Clostridiales bacterium]